MPKMAQQQDTPIAAFMKMCRDDGSAAMTKSMREDFKRSLMRASDKEDEEEAKKPPHPPPIAYSGKAFWPGGVRLAEEALQDVEGLLSRAFDSCWAEKFRVKISSQDERAFSEEFQEGKTALGAETYGETSHSLRLIKCKGGWWRWHRCATLWVPPSLSLETPSGFPLNKISLSFVCSR